MEDAGDRVFCHACGGVWLQNEHGLTCPTCHSDFTEIIEIPPDTEEAPDPPISVPRDRSESPVHNPNPFANHNPWATQDNHNSLFGDDPGGFSHRTYRSPDGRFSFTSTTYSHGFPQRRASGQQHQQQQQRGTSPPQADPFMMLRTLDSVFHGLAQTYGQAEQGQQQQRQGQTVGQDQPQAQQQRQRHGQGRTLYDGRFDFDVNLRSGMGPDYHMDGGLHPRDTDGPQPMTTPLRSLGELLELFRTDYGNNRQQTGGVRVMTGPDPMAILSTLLSLDRPGDAVYSQEELDRVISQLVDQTQNRSAAAPASQDAIRSLPKKKVDKGMLGLEGKAECSICMDPVDIGTEVTVLPCKHWFHYACIEMWLNQHNTCPHCRRGIDTPAQPGGSSDDPMIINDSPEPPSRRTSNANPEHSGQHSGQQPPSSWANLMGGSDGQQQQQQDHDGRRSSRSEGGGGGIAGWVRSRFGGV